MNVLLRRLTYQPRLIALARALGLRRVFRNWYYRWARPRTGIVQVAAGTATGQFWAHTPGELRMAEGRGREQHILELLISLIQPGDVFYDIGSGFGLYTVFLAKAVGEQGQVVAFEPEGESYQHLRANLTLNGLTNVRAFRKALGERNCEAKLYANSEEPWRSTLCGPVDARETGYEVIEVVEGDQFREAENLPLPRVVKIDVEGYEYAVIHGLQQTLAHPHCDLVCCEVHPTLLPSGVGPEAVSALLKSLGFAQIVIYPRANQFHALAYKRTLH